MVRKPDPQKRDLFLQAALKLFAANGVQNTATAAIAREAGTAAGTLFLYFPTKQDLINQLVLDIGKAQSEAVKSAITPELTARETFATIWQETVHWFLENMQAYRYIQQVRDSTLIPEEIAQESGKYLDYYFTAIQKGLAEPAIKPYPLELIGEMLYGAIVAVMNLIKSQPDSAYHEAYIRSGFEIFWNGIRLETE